MGFLFCQIWGRGKIFNDGFSVYILITFFVKRKIGNEVKNKKRNQKKVEKNFFEL
jgi:hypothetical protein